MAVDVYLLPKAPIYAHFSCPRGDNAIGHGMAHVPHITARQLLGSRTKTISTDARERHSAHAFERESAHVLKKAMHVVSDGSGLGGRCCNTKNQNIDDHGECVPVLATRHGLLLERNISIAKAVLD